MLDATQRSAMDVTATLCSWVSTTGLDDVPADVQSLGIQIVADVLGGMLASSTVPSCRSLVEALLGESRGPDGRSCVVGFEQRLDLLGAALVNGILGHGDEVDPTGSGGSGHYAASVVASAITVGDALGSTGQELLRAVILGGEVGGRLSRTLNRYGTTHPFHATSAFALASATTGGTLYELSAADHEVALGLATQAACGSVSHHRDPTHHAKSLAFGLAAHAGVLAAHLASRGIGGPQGVLESDDGFFAAFARDASIAPHVLDGLGSTYVIRDIGFKPYAAAGPAQGIIEALLALVDDGEVVLSDVASVALRISESAFAAVVVNDNPRVSLRAIVQKVLVAGRYDFIDAHLDPDVTSAEYRRVRDDVAIEIEAIPGTSSKDRRFEGEIRITLRDGTQRVEQVSLPKMSESRVFEKAHALASLALGPERASALIDAVRHMKDDTAVRDWLSVSP